MRRRKPVPAIYYHRHQGNSHSGLSTCSRSVGNRYRRVYAQLGFGTVGTGSITSAHTLRRIREGASCFRSEIPAGRKSPDGVIIRLSRVLNQVDFTAMPLGGHLALDLPANTPYHTYRLSDPDRWVIDLPNTQLSGEARHVEVDTGPVNRAGQSG